jgi:hypothetical protein
MGPGGMGGSSWLGGGWGHWSPAGLLAFASTSPADWLALCSRMNRWFADPCVMATSDRVAVEITFGTGPNSHCKELSGMVLGMHRLFAGGSRNLPITSYAGQGRLHFVDKTALASHD